MERSFHPYPIVAITRITLMSIILSSIILYLRDYIENIYITLLIVVWLIGLAFMLVAFISTRFQTLILEDNTMMFRSGLISLRKVVLPYAKITEASYTQGIIQRVFGVGTLLVDTAGGANVAIHMSDIKYADLKRILDEINSKGGKDSGT